MVNSYSINYFKNGLANWNLHQIGRCQVYLQLYLIRSVFHSFPITWYSWYTRTAGKIKSGRAKEGSSFVIRLRAIQLDSDEHGHVHDLSVVGVRQLERWEGLTQSAIRLRRSKSRRYGSAEAARSRWRGVLPAPPCSPPPPPPPPPPTIAWSRSATRAEPRRRPGGSWISAARSWPASRPLQTAHNDDSEGSDVEHPETGLLPHQLFLDTPERKEQPKEEPILNRLATWSFPYVRLGLKNGVPPRNWDEISQRPPFLQLCNLIKISLCLLQSHKTLIY